MPGIKVGNQSGQVGLLFWQPMVSVRLKLSAVKCTAERKERMYDLIQAYFGVSGQGDFKHDDRIIVSIRQGQEIRR